MKFTKISENAFKQIQLNAGIIVSSFTPSTMAIGDIIAATTDGVNIVATPTFSDFADNIDNARKNLKEFKVLESWEVKMSGTFVTVDAAAVTRLIGAADADSSDATHIVPRNSVKQADFKDLWWIGDYSDKNDGDTAGYCAVHLMNTISTGGLQLTTGDKEKGKFAFEFTAHYSSAEQDTVPFEVYIKAGA